MKSALTGARIFDGRQFHDECALIIENQYIDGIVPAEDIPQDCQCTSVDGGILTPGFIDLQINGAGGVLFNNAPHVETLKTMSDALLPFGVTRLLPTLMTDTQEVTIAAVNAAVQAQADNPGILGIHVEGPFFSPLKRGIHSRERIRTLTESDWAWIATMATVPAILTLAPEQVHPTDIRRIHQSGIRVSAGHSNATYAQIFAAHDAGLSGFTHLFNAMRQLTAREPGVVGAALELRDTWAGLIADGIHVHPGSMRLALQNKGPDKLFLVSDAMATVGSTDRSFELYGERITEKDGKLLDQEGALAGSTISLIDAVRYCVTDLNLSLEQALAMASRIPAEYMTLSSRFGRFTAGAHADICHLNTALQVLNVWRDGQSVFHARDSVDRMTDPDNTGRPPVSLNRKTTGHR